MDFLELFLIAIGVSMDAFAVSICKGLSVRKVRPGNAVAVGLWFGGFQALMPLIGYFLGASFADFVAAVDHWIAFFLLLIIGLNMIRESLDNESCDVSPDFTCASMLLLSLATSVDAMAVGLSFAFQKVSIFPAAAIIGITTGILSVSGVYVGKAFGCRYKSKAEFIGGLILCLMGLKILLE